MTNTNAVLRFRPRLSLASGTELGPTINLTSIGLAVLQRIHFSRY